MDQYELFEAYLQNKLDPKDKLDLETKLQTDKVFNEDFESHRKLQEAFDVMVEDDVKTHINFVKNRVGTNEIQSDKDRPVKELKSQSSFAKTKWYFLAASFLFLSIASYYLFTEGDDLQKDPIAEYFDFYQKENTRSQDGEVSLFEKYGFVINQSIKEENWDFAVQQLNLIISEYNGIIKDEAQWNLAVVYSKTDPPKAKAILTAITKNDKHYYHDDKDALALLEWLKEN